MRLCDLFVAVEANDLPELGKQYESLDSFCLGGSATLEAGGLHIRYVGGHEPLAKTVKLLSGRRFELLFLISFHQTPGLVE